MAGAALHLLVDAPLEVGAAVKAECNDTLMLGEVCHCRPDAGHYAVGVKLEHALLHTTELARLAARLLEGMPPDAAPAQRRDASELNPPAKP